MSSLNNVMLVGRVGGSPELRQSKSGTAWMRLSMATDRHIKGDDGWETETDWHRVKLFGQVAEQAMRRCKPGTQIVVNGKLSYDSWKDDDGQKRRSACVVADRVAFGRNQIQPASPGA